MVAKVYPGTAQFSESPVISNRYGELSLAEKASGSGVALGTVQGPRMRTLA